MGPETKGWGGRTEKAVANYDEDSLTMGIAAAVDCLKGVDRSSIDAVYFASTTSPYLEKQAAAIVVAAADLSKEVYAADFGGSLRAGTIALKAALDAVRAGSAKRVLVVTSDLRVPQAGSAFEQAFGDGAVAFLVGDSEIAATIEDSYFISDEILDVWRTGDNVMHSAEDRFALERGYLDLIPRTVSGLLKKSDLAPKDFTKAVFYGPDARRHAQMARMLGFDPKTQVQDPLFTTVGNTGAAFALMILVAALEDAKAGDRILLANYGNGGDAFTLRVTENVVQLKNGRGVKGYLQSKRTLSDYQKYARWRGLIEVASAAARPERVAPSLAALRRDRDEVMGLYGVKCKSCGYPQFPPQRVCTRCHTKDNFEPYRFAHKKATLFTFAADYLAETPDPPFIIGVLNFEGGGRMKAMLTDADVNQLQVGMPVEMSFRKLYQTGGIHHYFWKGMPVRV
jgi:3-hydroxy-3-methylglutaryl CoA synthase